MTFEEALPEIDILLKKNKHKWQLTAIVYMDYDDVCQQIKLHLWKKWTMYDQKKELAPWVNTIIGHQLLNLQRNHYYYMSKPCLRCAANEGGDLCSIYQKQCEACPIYKKWFRTKKHAQDINLPVSMTNHENEVHEKIDESFDIERATSIIHEKVAEKLKSSDYIIYQYLYIKHLNDNEVLAKMGYKNIDKSKKNGYTILNQTKKRIMVVVREVVKDIEFN